MGIQKQLFSNHIDLEEIIVPETYIQPSSIFEMMNVLGAEMFGYIDGRILERNYPKPSGRIIPNHTYEVRTYIQVGYRETTHEEHLDFSRIRKARNIGLYGFLLFIQQFPNAFQIEDYVAIFDHGTHLLSNANKDICVPLVRRNTRTRKIDMCLSHSSSNSFSWDQGHIFMIFSQIKMHFRALNTAAEEALQSNRNC